jgi:hypothetical protein
MSPTRFLRRDNSIGYGRPIRFEHDQINRAFASDPGTDSFDRAAAAQKEEDRPDQQCFQYRHHLYWPNIY